MKRSMILFFLLTTIGAAAQTETLEIIPGTGVGPFKLGMSEEKVKEIAGGTFTTTTYKEEMAVLWRFNNNIAIDSLVHFVLGFDKCLEADSTIEKKWPVFKLYFKNNKLNFITLTSYRADSAIARQAVLGGKLTFFDTKQQSREILGDDFIVLPYPANEVACYNKKGLTIMFEEDMIRVIMLFPPSLSFSRIMKEKSRLLKKEFQASGDSGL